MEKLIILLVSFLSSIYGNTKREMCLPPRITKDLSPLIHYYRPNSEVTLECGAEGVNTPEYSWYLNGTIMSVPGVMGNLELKKPNVLLIKASTWKDQGFYYCVATNIYGEARTNVSTLIEADIKVHKADEKAIRVEEYQSLKLDCDNLESVPTPTYKWMIRKDDTDFKSSFALYPRMAIDDEGSLHFGFVMHSDQKHGYMYTCEAYNRIKDGSQGTGYARLQVNKNETMSLQSLKIRPKLLFASGSSSGFEVRRLVGEDVTLSCFYSSYPHCTYAWSMKDREGNVRSVATLAQNHATEVAIRAVGEEDEGVYSCSCANEHHSASQDIRLTVEAKPMMRSGTDLLLSQNVTEGDTAYFNCNPYANPPPQVKWFVNKILVKEETLGSRWSMNGDKTQLVIRDACKDCHSASSAEMKGDLGVIRCDAKNQHGSVTYSAYLNVLKRTKITDAPKDKEVKFEGQGVLQASFFCSASSDALTPLRLRWQFVPLGKTFPENVHAVDGKIRLENENQTLMINVENSTEWTKYEGSYICLADNGYSKQNVSAELKVVMPTTIAPLVEASVAQASFPWWLLVLLVCVALLLLLLLLCCCCLWRHKGGVYKVDQKERKTGNNPDKELKEDGFHDYQRPSTDFLKGSRGSLGSSIPMNSDDEGSLNEYGDIDAGKFGEDGSFIGDYKTENRNKNAHQGNNNSHSNGNGVSNGNVYGNNSFGTNGYQRV